MQTRCPTGPNVVQTHLPHVLAHPRGLCLVVSDGREDQLLDCCRTKPRILEFASDFVNKGMLGVCALKCISRPSTACSGIAKLCWNLWQFTVQSMYCFTIIQRQRPIAKNDWRRPQVQASERTCQISWSSAIPRLHSEPLRRAW